MPPECGDDGRRLLHKAGVGCTTNMEAASVFPEAAKRGSQVEANGPAAQRLPPSLPPMPLELQRAYFSAIPMVLDVPSLKEPGMRAPEALFVNPRLLRSPNTSLLIA